MPDTTLQEARNAQELAETKLATLEATAKAKSIEQAIRPIYEDSWASADPRTMRGWGSPPVGAQQWAEITGQTTLTDREGERFLPYYENEADLRRKRAEWRNVGAFSSIAIGAQEALINYVIGSGFTFVATACREEHDPIAQTVQAVVDQFLEDNNIIGGLDAEIVERSRGDGECGLALYPNDWRTRVCIVEPDQITEPYDTPSLEAWLGAEGVSYWAHGVHTKAIQLGPNAWIDDSAHPLGYHVVFDPVGDNWDYLPINRFQHVKRNTPVNARRGVSDFMPVLRDLDRESKLRGNTAEGAAIQAAIAFIREHAPGTTQSTVSSLVSSEATGNYRQSRENGSALVQTRRFNPGSILNTGSGVKYHAGPLGSIQSPIYIEVAGYLLRSIGVRWSMPEYIISGDASNANFASTLVSESPFVKARERDQKFYQRHFRQMAWKAVRIAHEAGYFQTPWDELRRCVTLEVESPDVATRDALANAQEKQLLHQSGVISRRTWASEAGYDYDEELTRRADEPVDMPQPIMQESWNNYP